MKPLCLLTAKPAIYVANIDEIGFKDNPLLARVEEYAAREGAPVVLICAALESEIAELPDEDKEIFLADLNLEEPGLNRLIRAAYQLLGLQTYFTAGVKEVRAWTISKGDTAPQAAAVIHTDFEKGLSAPKSSAMTTSLPARASRARRRLAKCGWKEGICGEGWGCDAFQVQHLTRFCQLSENSMDGSVALYLVSIKNG